MQAVRIHEYGGVDRLRVEDIPVPVPGKGEILIHHRAIGLNFADIHNRTGRYPLPHLPHVLGVEGVGIVEALGPDVKEFSIGDRVGYATAGPAIAPGSYCEARVMDVRYPILLPDEVDDITAAGMLVKGLTAQYLIKGAYQVHPTETVLIYAASGGVGQILSQWCAHIGARVIGVVGSRQKVPIALGNGCTHALVLGEDNIVARTRQLTGGAGVQVVYDSVGKDTYLTSLACLRTRGTLVSFGTSSGKVPPVDLFKLNTMGSLSITSAAFASFFRNREEVMQRGSDLIDAVLRGAIRVHVTQTFGLADVAKAHAAMESRQTSGSTVLLPPGR